MFVLFCLVLCCVSVQASVRRTAVGLSRVCLYKHVYKELCVVLMSTANEGQYTHHALKVWHCDPKHGPRGNHENQLSAPPHRRRNHHRQPRFLQLSAILTMMEITCFVVHTCLQNTDVCVCFVHTCLQEPCVSLFSVLCFCLCVFVQTCLRRHVVVDLSRRFCTNMFTRNCVWFL